MVAQHTLAPAAFCATSCSILQAPHSVLAQGSKAAVLWAHHLVVNEPCVLHTLAPSTTRSCTTATLIESLPHMQFLDNRPKSLLYKEI